MSNQILGQVIEGATLAEAIRQDEKPPKPRFEGCTFQNRSTQYAMLTTLYQGHDESGEDSRSHDAVIHVFDNLIETREQTGDFKEW